MNKILEQIHPFKCKDVETLLKDKRFVNNVKEAWIFGSVSCNNPNKHNAFSDLNIAVVPIFTDPNDENIDDEACKNIYKAIRDATKNSNGKFDIIWLTTYVLNHNDDFINNDIKKKGIKIIWMNQIDYLKYLKMI